MAFKRTSLTCDESIIAAIDKEVEELNKNNSGKIITRNWLIGQILKEHVNKNKTE